jgi:hypothetical protein
MSQEAVFRADSIGASIAESAGQCIVPICIVSFKRSASGNRVYRISILSPMSTRYYLIRIGTETDLLYRSELRWNFSDKPVG